MNLIKLWIVKAIKKTHVGVLFIYFFCDRRLNNVSKRERERSEYVSVMIYMRFNQNIESLDGKVAIGHNIDMFVTKDI